MLKRLRSLNGLLPVSTMILLWALAPKGAMFVGLALRRWPMVSLLLFAFIIGYPSSGFPRMRRLGMLLSFVVVVWFSLASTWHFGLSDSSVLGGLLQWSDSNGYAMDAKLHLHGIDLSAFTSRRPLFTTFLTTLFWFVNGNVKSVLLILATLSAVCSFLFIEVLDRRLGKWVATVAACLLFVFYSRFTAVTLTEQLGMNLGMLGCLLLMTGTAESKVWPFMAGLSVLTLALNARAGAFFILPSLILWSAVSRHFKTLRLHLFLVACGSVMVAFMFNAFVYQQMAAKEAAAFANFSHTLYGIVSGGKGWAQIFVDHPEVASLHERELSRAIYELAWLEFLKHPFGIPLGAIRSWVDFFTPRGMGVFGFVAFDRLSDFRVWNVTKVLTTAVQFALICSLIVGVFRLWQQRKDAVSGMLLWAIGGIFASVPFVPPYDADQMRAYAATMPILWIATAIGMAGKVKGSAELVPRHSFGNTTAALVLSLCFVVTTIAGATVMKGRRGSFAGDPSSCGNGQFKIWHQLDHGSQIHLVSESQLGSFGSLLSQEVIIQQSAFLRGLTGFGYTYPNHTRVLERLRSGDTLMNAVDLITRDLNWVFFPNGEFPSQYYGKVVRLCGSLVEGTKALQMPLYKIESVVPIETGSPLSGPRS